MAENVRKDRRPAVVTFGEPMLRYSVPQGERLSEARSLLVHAGGAELNVAVDLVNLGEAARYITAVPASPLSHLLQRLVGAHGLSLAGDLGAPGRLGIYYYEPGVPPRPGVVTYDREGSSFSRYPWSRFSWETVLEPGGLFFTTGITTALGPEPLAGVRSAFQAAARQEVPVAFDVNYRAKLWPVDEARRTLVPLLEGVDILFTSLPDAIQVLGAPEQLPEELAPWLAERFGLQAVTLVYSPPAHGPECAGGDRPAEAIQWRAIAWRQGETAVWDQPSGVVTVDRLGAGDAYAAGFLWALRHGRTLADAVRFGSAMMALKNTVHGDFCPVGLDELEAVAGGNHGGLQR